MSYLSNKDILIEYDKKFDNYYNEFIKNNNKDVYEKLKKETKELLITQCNRLNNVTKENSKLLSNLQSYRGNILVYIRVRPVIEGNNEDTGIPSIDVYDSGSLSIRNTKDNTFKPFAFDECFGQNVNQEGIFDQLSHLAASVMNGYNVSVIAYGQTGSGKTYTMFGTKTQPGLIFRLTEKIFDFIASSVNIQTSVRLSMIEIYNEEVYDLLGKEAKQKVKVNMAGDDISTDASEIDIPDNDAVREWFEKGMEIRSTASTNANSESSRSHCILTLYIDQFNKETSETTTSKLYMVDLAGSERIAKTGAEGDRLTEAKHINKSLSALSDIMQALDKKSSHVPYRNSKLTMILKDSLNGNAKTILFCTLCPTDTQYEETLSTLGFAQRAKNINLGAAKQNVQFRNADQENKELKGKIEDIKKENGKLHKKITELENQIKSAEDKINMQKSSNMKKGKEVRQEVDELRDKNSEYQAQILKYREEQNRLNKELQNKDRNIKVLSTTVDNLQHDKTNLTKENEDLEYEVDQLKSQIRQMNRNSVSSPLSTRAAVSYAQKNSSRNSTPRNSTPRNSTPRNNSPIKPSTPKEKLIVDPIEIENNNKEEIKHTPKTSEDYKNEFWKTMKSVDPISPTHLPLLQPEDVLEFDKVEILTLQLI